ncbi:hypothetical protein [Hymenobacter nivis]|nr:hypothetical protein [Hymenobacter nivis]
MRPFLLEFVDSAFFQAFMIGLMIVVGLGVLGAAAVLWVLARDGLRGWRNLRAAPGPLPWAQRLEAVRLLLPVALVGLLAAGKGGQYLYQSDQEGQRWGALQTQKVALQSRAPGRYFLADTLLRSKPYPKLVHRLSKANWPLPDTTVLVAGQPYSQGVEGRRRPTPYAELTLRANGTFDYHSNIEDDATGNQAAGIWKVECVACQALPSASAYDISSYAPLFYVTDRLTGEYAPTGGALAARFENGRLIFWGSRYDGGRLSQFELKAAAPGAPATGW